MHFEYNTTKLIIRFTIERKFHTNKNWNYKNVRIDKNRDYLYEKSEHRAVSRLHDAFY